MKNEIFISQYLDDVGRIAGKIDQREIQKMIAIIDRIRHDRGRLFIIGVGGGAANASHAVSDFRKIANLECYSPCDNVAELTATVNDDGWETVYSNWLKGSRLNGRDGVLVFSVGGGNAEKRISTNIIAALDFARAKGAKIMGVVGRDGGYTACIADACVLIPPINPETVTAHTEAFQAVIWHLIVSHPAIKKSEMKWESIR